jgi:hypothetical protein
MLEDLSREVPRAVRASAHWPKTDRSFSDELRRIAPQLRAHGISVTKSRSHDSRLTHGGGS